MGCSKLREPNTLSIVLLRRTGLWQASRWADMIWGFELPKISEDCRQLAIGMALDEFTIMPMRHVLSALVQNIPGVLAHVSGMLASRGYNIDSLAVGETEKPGISRMTFVVVGDDRILDQVRKQLEKIVTVVRVDDISSQVYVERDLMLLKVKSAPAARSEIRELVDIFRGRIVDVGPDELMIEISGRESKIEAFIERMRQYEILELVRTGRIAMVRSQSQPQLDKKPLKAAGVRQVVNASE